MSNKKGRGSFGGLPIPYAYIEAAPERTKKYLEAVSKGPPKPIKPKIQKPKRSAKELYLSRLVQGLDAQLLGFVGLGTGVFTHHHTISVGRDTATDFAA